MNEVGRLVIFPSSMVHDVDLMRVIKIELQYHLTHLLEEKWVS